jgi:hypothetical protein
MVEEINIKNMVMLKTNIREVFGSNLGWGTGCPNCLLHGFPQFL